jgi:transposase
VCAANVADVKAAPNVLFWIAQQYQRLVKVLADQGYRGELETNLDEVYDVLLQVVEHQGKRGFQVQPKRWIVERTLAWLENARALNRDYERLPENHEGMVYVAMIRLMLRRLGHNRRNWNKKTAKHSFTNILLTNKSR